MAGVVILRGCAAAVWVLESTLRVHVVPFRLPFLLLFSFLLFRPHQVATLFYPPWSAIVPSFSVYICYQRTRSLLLVFFPVCFDRKREQCFAAFASIFPWPCSFFLPFIIIRAHQSTRLLSCAAFVCISIPFPKPYSRHLARSRADPYHFLSLLCQSLLIFSLPLLSLSLALPVAPHLSSQRSFSTHRSSFWYGGER